MPPVPALLPGYLGRVDAVAGLRDACRDAVTWLLDGSPAQERTLLAADQENAASKPGSSVAVLADPPDEPARRRGVVEPLGLRVARALLDGGRARPVDAPGPLDRRLLVMANGSGCRGEKAPGHLDPRSFAFDERIEKALATGDRDVLAGLDADLGHELLAAGIVQLKWLGTVDARVRSAELRYADDPYGVRYWVATWLLTR
jgi:hypothetical protein